MDDMNDQPFERQVADVASRAVGPERHVEALAIARHAAEKSRRRRLPSLFGAMKFATGALVVAAFAVFLVMSGVFDGIDDQARIGASPSASASADGEVIEPGPAEVLYAGGSFKEIGIEWPGIDGPWSDEPFGQDLSVASGAAQLATPRYFSVASTDSRLVGEAVLRTAIGRWEHGLTVEDLEAIRPVGSIETTIGRLEIRNEGGSWEGIIGPSFRADGEWELDSGGEAVVVRPAPALSGRDTAVLEGRGAYDGLTAYIGFGRDADGPLFGASAVRDGAFTEYEAVIVNSEALSPLSDGQWAEAWEWIDLAREAGAIE